MSERERESSVVVSLNELLRMEEQRRHDVADAERARTARLEREREAAAARANAEEEQRRMDAEARRRDSALRSAVEGAQIDAAKSTQIEKTRLEILVRMQADEIASRDAHARELANHGILAAQKGRTTTVVSAALAAVAIAVAVVAILAVSRQQPVAAPAIDRWGQIARLCSPVVIYRRPLDDSPNMVAIRHSVGQTAQHHCPRTRAKDRALRAIVKGVAMAVGRQYLALFEQIAPALGQFDGHAARQSHVAFAVQQGLASHVRGDQRCGTGGLNIDAWPFEVEDKGRAG